LNGKIGSLIEQMIERWFLEQHLSTAAAAPEASHDDAIDTRPTCTCGAALAVGIRIFACTGDP
jgi:hypothetical protein